MEDEMLLLLWLLLVGLVWWWMVVVVALLDDEMVVGLVLQHARGWQHQRWLGGHPCGPRGVLWWHWRGSWQSWCCSRSLPRSCWGGG